MSTCKCGRDIIDNKRRCNFCIKEWLDNRLSAYESVKLKIGEPKNNNEQLLFIKEIKKEEKRLSNTKND